MALDTGAWLNDPVWVHGDLLPGNLLVRQDRLCGVIDWSGAGIGDPACDAMVAWAFPSNARRIFREAVGFDDATWARARGWVVEQTILYIPYYERTLPLAVEQAKQRLHAALENDGCALSCGRLAPTAGSGCHTMRRAAFFQNSRQIPNVVTSIVGVRRDDIEEIHLAAF